VPAELNSLNGLDVETASSTPADEVLRLLSTAPSGLSSSEVAARLLQYGANAVRIRRTRAWVVLGRQLKSPLLVLLAVTATASYFVGEQADAIIIGVILLLSVGLGFWNEFRAEQAAEALRARISYQCLAWRDGGAQRVDVDALVPGDVVELELGEVVPADIRLLAVDGLECDESVLTGESSAVEKDVAAVAPGAALPDLASCALMGTVVQAGSGRGVVVTTGVRTQLGRLAVQLTDREPETEFQAGLRQFSVLIVQVAAVLTISIFAINVVLHRPILDALLFSLAIAVGITPQLLPAIVSTSLAAGSHELARRKVLVKRLVCIEDLGDIDVLFTDKTGTLTEGRITFMRALGADGLPADDPLRLGLVCNEAVVQDGQAVGGNALDVALWQSAAAALAAPAAARSRRLAVLPFDHHRQLASVLVQEPGAEAVQVTKGAPEAVLALCTDVSEAARAAVAAEFADGSRVVAVATRPAAGRTSLAPDDERDLRLAGFLVFLDAPKASAAAALARLASLGITVKVVTGDNAKVAEKVCADLGLEVLGTLTGSELAQIPADELMHAVQRTTVFARVSPEQKARIVRAQRSTGVDVAFLGDGVNDALALHAADVGISVDSGSDVAKNAADVVLLEKDLGVLADGVSEGRRIFANTMKYVLMGTSSNFGNMFSAAGASVFLSFLPMLPSQILLNNLLYDTSQLAIPTDNVDPEEVAQPRRWDVAFVRRFMLVFGPISSIFDFATFAVMLWGFHAGPVLFRSGWFVESLATQSLVIFCIRTRRIPFVRSRPSRPVLLAALAVVLVGALLPESPLASVLGFRALPWAFFLTLMGMVVTYLVLIELTKAWFYRTVVAPVPDVRPRRAGHRIKRRAERFTSAAPREPGTRPARPPAPDAHGLPS
jgi:P-type Mg2+ transporter